MRTGAAASGAGKFAASALHSLCVFTLLVSKQHVPNFVQEVAEAAELTEHPCAAQHAGHCYQAMQVMCHMHNSFKSAA